MTTEAYIRKQEKFLKFVETVYGYKVWRKDNNQYTISPRNGVIRLDPNKEIEMWILFETKLGKLLI